MKWTSKPDKQELEHLTSWNVDVGHWADIENDRQRIVKIFNNFLELNFSHFFPWPTYNGYVFKAFVIAKSVLVFVDEDIEHWDLNFDEWVQLEQLFFKMFCCFNAADNVVWKY